MRRAAGFVAEAPFARHPLLRPLCRRRGPRPGNSDGPCAARHHGFDGQPLACLPHEQVAEEGIEPPDRAPAPHPRLNPPPPREAKRFQLWKVPGGTFSRGWRLLDRSGLAPRAWSPREVILVTVIPGRGLRRGGGGHAFCGDPPPVSNERLVQRTLLFGPYFFGTS